MSDSYDFVVTRYVKPHFGMPPGKQAPSLPN